MKFSSDSKSGPLVFICDRRVTGDYQLTSRSSIQVKEFTPINSSLAFWILSSSDPIGTSEGTQSSSSESLDLLTLGPEDIEGGLSNIPTISSLLRCFSIVPGACNPLNALLSVFAVISFD